MEHLPLYACQGQNRDVDYHDDKLAEHRRLSDLLGGVEDDIEAFCACEAPVEAMLLFGKPPDAVLHDDYSPVHYDPEIQGAETHKICAYPVPDHPGNRKQH